jgi:hypothetical protein
MHFYDEGGYTARINMLGGVLKVDLLGTVAPGKQSRLAIDLLRNEIYLGGLKVRLQGSGCCQFVA